MFFPICLDPDLDLRIHLKGVVISDYSYEPSHYSCIRTLGDWLASQGIPGIYGVDTRRLGMHGDCGIFFSSNFFGKACEGAVEHHSTQQLILSNLG